MLVVTHEMAFARRLADRIIFMEKGQLIEQGPPDSFFDNPQTERAKNFLRSIVRVPSTGVPEVNVKLVQVVLMALG